MEMIDVLKKLQEIAETKPELVKDAVENVTRTNPKVDEGKMKDYLHSEAEKMSREEFIKKHGEHNLDLWTEVHEELGDLEEMQSKLKEMQTKFDNVVSRMNKAIDKKLSK